MSEHVVISPNQAPYSVSGPSEEQGFTYDQRGAVNNPVYRVSSDMTLAPEDGSVVLLDGSSEAVTLTVDAIPAGSRVTIIAEDVTNAVGVAAGEGVTFNVGTAAGGNLDQTAGATVEATHAADGEVYLNGDLVS